MLRGKVIGVMAYLRVPVGVVSGVCVDLHQLAALLFSRCSAEVLEATAIQADDDVAILGYEIRSHTRLAHGGKGHDCARRIYRR